MRITIDASRPGAKELLAIMEGRKTVSLKQSPNNKDIVCVRMNKVACSPKRSKRFLRRFLPVPLGKSSDQEISRHSFAVVLK